MQKQGIARRTKIAKHAGIYYRDTAAGRRYEITFLDATGSRRWRTMDGGLREAQAALDEARQRSRRGERTAPASAPRASRTTRTPGSPARRGSASGRARSTRSTCAST